MRILARQFRRILLITAVYAVLGKLSLFLAIPPGYASPIFPPSGVALVALLLWGYGMGVGVWLGCFLLYQGWPPFGPSWGEFWVDFWLSSCACFEVLVGAWLIRRYIPAPTDLIRKSDVLRFLLFGALVSPGVGALTGAASLVWTGTIPPNSYLFSAWNWWIGDAIGVLIFAPLLLSFVGEPQSLWRKRRVSVALPLGLTFIVYVVMLFQSTGWQQRSTRMQFEPIANEVATRIRKSLEGYLDSLYALEGIFLTAKGDAEEAFHIAGQRWLKLYPGIYDFSWNPKVTLADRDGFEKRVRARGLTNYEILDRLPDGKIVRAADRPEYYPSEFVVPKRSVDNVLGFDTLNPPERTQSVLKARDTGKPVATTPTILAQKVSKREALIVLLGVYRGEHSTVEQRRRNMWGFVKIAVSLADVMSAALGEQHDKRYRIAVYDRELTSPLYSTFDAKHSLPATVWEETVDFADRHFTVKIAPTEAYWNNKREPGSWILLGAGLALIGLLAMFLLVMTGDSFTLEKELSERSRISRELARSNADLEQYAYAASHDLQEPLRTISNHLQLIEMRLSGKLTDDTQESLNFAVDSSRRMRDIIHDLLEYSRVGRSNSLPLPTEVRELIETALRDLQTAIDESGAQIEIGDMPHLPLVRTEGIVLFENLLGNALKYRDKSRPPKIVVSCKRRRDDWLFGVRDNGIGIPVNCTERIFLMFQRLHGRSQYSGTGIGLALCKRIVECHGGQIWVESREGSGSTFFFTIPA